MRVNPKYIQLFADALIPLLGFFWWNWSLYFIVLFYLLDYVSNEVFIHLKAKKITEYRKESSDSWIKKGMISAVLLVSCFILIHLAMRAIEPSIQFIDEVNSFWSYKDMGIEQGYILLPLIGIVGYQRYKIEFLVTKLFQVTTMSQLWKSHISAHLMLIGFVALVIGVSGIIVFSESFYIFGIVIVSSLFQLIASK
jgi:hypothetical protein